MSDSQSNKVQDALALEETVARYLTDNPDFFQQHQELLGMLEIPHPNSGTAHSLIERQVEVLRADNSLLQTQLSNLVTAARKNEELTDKLLQLAVFLASMPSTEQVLDQMPKWMCKEFELDAVALKLNSEHWEGFNRLEVVNMQTDFASAIMERISHRRSICDDRLPQNLLEYLFAEHAARVGSSALVPLVQSDNIIFGVLAIGSADPERYGAEQGTLYLDKLGKLVGSTLLLSRN